MNGSRHFVVLANPSAGGGKVAKHLPELESALLARGLEFEVQETTSLEDGCDKGLAAAEQGSIPVVYSGDGLIGAVGGALAGTGTAMGVIPGGRGNDLARVLKIPKLISEAVEALAAGHTRTIDVGDVNGHRFLGSASFGLDSDGNKIANETTFLPGQSVYIYAFFRALAAWKPARFTLTLDGETSELTAYSIAISNNRAYGGGMYIAPHAELDDGLFDVVCIGDVSKLRLLRKFPDVFKGTHIDNPETTVRRAAEVQVSADRPFTVYSDGEYVADLPATVTMLPRALDVIAPPGELGVP